MIRFEGSNLSSVTESENISGLLIPRSFVSLPDTGCAVLTGQSEGTGGGISECTVLVLDRSLGTAAAVQVSVSPKEITSVEVLSQTMLIHTAEKTYQVDFTACLSGFGNAIKKASRRRRLFCVLKSVCQEREGSSGRSAGIPGLKQQISSRLSRSREAAGSPSG